MPNSIGRLMVSPSISTASSTEKNGLRRLIADALMAPRCWIDAYTNTRPTKTVRNPASANQLTAAGSTSGQPRLTASSTQIASDIRNVMTIDRNAPLLRLLPSWPRTIATFVSANSVIDTIARVSPTSDGPSSPRPRDCTPRTWPGETSRRCGAGATRVPVGGASRRTRRAPSRCRRRRRASNPVPSVS